MTFLYRGTKDADGRFDVFGTVTYENGDIVSADFVHGVKEGQVVMISPRNQNVSRIVGRCVNDKLEGKGKIISAETAVTDCFFRNGCIHGPVRRFTMKKFREFRQQLDFLGTYQKGKPWGMCWEYREGGGFLVGKVDPSNGEFSGDEGIAYLYPDLSTALLGAFVGGTMKAAKSTRLIGVTLDPSTQIMTPVFAQTLPHQPVMRYSKATAESIGHQPMVSDPYEDCTVRVRSSGVEGGGDGLFAQKDLAKGSMVAFYNGVRLPYRVGVKEEWATSGYKIYINADYESGERMDIPEECQSLDVYCATLGHKLNHSFRPNCEEWFIDHPRFGRKNIFLFYYIPSGCSIKLWIGNLKFIRIRESLFTL
mgnify:FL=1